MKYEIKMKDKITHEQVNRSVQDLADVQACEDFIAANPLTFENFDTEIVEYVAPIESISPRQIRLALLAIGKTDSDVESAINNLSSPDKEMAMIAWRYSTKFERSIPSVEAIGALLGYSSEELNQIWIAGKDF